MSYYHPSSLPRKYRLPNRYPKPVLAIIVLTPVWLFWKAYYAVRGRAKLSSTNTEPSRRMIRRLTPPWWVPKPPTTLNEVIKTMRREDSFLRRILPPAAIEDTEL